MVLAEALATVVPGIDPCLVPPAAAPGLLATARALPDDTAAAYIECRPDPLQDRVDLLACLLSTADPAPKRGVHYRDGSYIRPDGRRDVDGTNDDGWQLARDAQRCRRTRGTTLQGRSPLVWLELDDVGRAASLPSPSVCVCLVADYLDRNRYAQTASDCEVMAAEASALAGISREESVTVARCIRLLPRRARAIHLSFMRARTPKATKLYVRAPLDEAMRYLQEVGWRGNRHAVADVLEWRRTRDDNVYLDISIEGAAVVPRLALAFPRGERGERFDGDVFDGLAGRTLDPALAARARDAAVAWTSTEPALRIGNGWPHVVHRWIDQKIVFNGGAPELKLYLSVRPLPALFGDLSAAGRR